MDEMAFQVCEKCGSLMGNPTLHEEFHEELLLALTKWADLLSRATHGVEVVDL